MSVVYIVRSAVKPERDDEWHRWQAEEHIPSLLGLPGYLGVQRFAERDAAGHYLNVWRIEAPECFGTPDYRTASLTPWFDELRPFYAVTVDFGIERIDDGDDVVPGRASWREQVESLVVDRETGDECTSSAAPMIDDDHLTALASVPGVAKVTCLDPIEVGHVRTARSAAPGVVALIYGRADLGSLPALAGGERRLYRPLGPYLEAP